MFFKRLFSCFPDVFGFMKVLFQVAYGSWKLSNLSKPRITIFGGARLGQKTKFAQDAFDLAQRFVNHGVSVITGGGSGVMHAANCGAISKIKSGVKSVGIGVKELGEGKNPCVQEYFELEYFFARKWLMTRHAQAFVVFPGGFGTMDELAEIITLIQTKKLPRLPIVMVGEEYWRDFIEWLNFSAVAHGLIKREDLELFTLTDDIDKVFTIVCEECEKLTLRVKK
ncbi:TIGR00730 family Rossman fold protein [Candidatus Dependentiae bacterium]